jgi:hypothetical protein
VNPRDLRVPVWMRIGGAVDLERRVLFPINAIRIIKVLIPPLTSRKVNVDETARLYCQLLQRIGD